MKAVIYARYSSDSQRDESIDGQIRECTEYAQKENITILGTYIDRALSARTADRPDFQRMIADSEKGMFDAVLVWKLDRFSRDRYDSAHYKHILKKNGVRVISAKEAISDGPEGIILESMLEGMNEYYSAELAVKIRRGQKENALKCKANGGGKPLGYLVDPETHKYIIDPITAPIVREVFERYANGEMIQDIADSLNEKGIKTAYGTVIRISTISVMLRNRKYIGEYKYGDIIIPDGVPAIVDKDLFERVQRRMERNRRSPARMKATEPYLLSSKIFCGYCGSPMLGECGTTRKGVVHHYYKCYSAKRRQGCTHRKGLKKDTIEKAVVLYTVNRVLQTDVINRIADSILVLQGQADTTTPALKAQLKECEKGITNLVNAIQAGILTQSTKERLEQLEEDREKLKTSILQAQLKRPQFSKEEIVSWIERFKYGNIDDPDYRSEVIDTFVNSVYVYDDKVILTYNYKDGSDTISKEAVDRAFGSDMEKLAPPLTKPCMKMRGFCCISPDYCGPFPAPSVSGQCWNITRGFACLHI